MVTENREQRRAAFIELLHAQPKEPRMAPPEAQTYSAEERKTLAEQIHRYCAARGIAQGRMAGMLGISGSSFSELMRGEYAGDTEKHLKKIAQFLDREAERSQKPGLKNFVDTTVSDRIFKALRQNHTHGTMGAVVGESGAGKTRAFIAYAQRNEGVIVVSASTWCSSFVQLSKQLAEVVLRGKKRSQTKRTQDRCELLVEELQGSPRLLIVDQAHQLQDKAFEFLQNLWDQCNPLDQERRLGVVLGCTNRFIHQIYSPDALYMFEQLTRRIDAGVTYSVPPAPFKLSDMRKLFSEENVRFPVADETLAALLKIANTSTTDQSVASGLASAIAKMEHVQNMLIKHTAPSRTEITSQMISDTDEISLRKSSRLQRRSAA